MMISFIIVNYQSQQFLRRCVKSIFKYAPLFPCEIIIANNDTLPLDDFSGSPIIKIINNQKNLGFAQACNKAVQQSKGNILFFLNPDTEMTASNTEELVKILDDETVGIVAPQLITFSGSAQPWGAGYEITPLSTVLNKFKSKKVSTFSTNNSTIEVDWVSGGALVIPKKLFNECRGFDEKFFLYFEDVDLCKQVRSLNKKIMLVPSIKILHFGGQSFADFKKQKEFYYQSQDYYFKKNFGLISAYFIWLLRKVFIFKKLL
jgi:N-acetylglucosaminyl-diphospho-decaprenol L-rhamnosyltransferase